MRRIPIFVKHRRDDWVVLFLFLKFGFFLSLFSALFNYFAAYEHYLIVEASLLYIVQPPLIRISKCFYVFVHHLKSFVEKLLKSNYCFGAKKCRNYRFVSKRKVSLSFPSLDSWLNFLSCIWFDLLIFWSVKSILYSKSKSVILSFFHFEEKLSKCRFGENISILCLVFFFWHYSH